jgi:hypothetical protein
MKDEPEHISVGLDRHTAVLLDCWRRQQVLIPTRRAAVRHLLRKMLQTKEMVGAVTIAPTQAAGEVSA